MKFVDEYRDPEKARRLAEEIADATTRPWTLMEVCGGQTHAIMKYGIHQMLPDLITLLHGPGCPVCVTPAEIIDQAAHIARQPNATLCSFGDMLRVPGNVKSLTQAKARGGDVRIVYSPLDALKTAQDSPENEVVFLAIGFETTAPMAAMAVHQAFELGLKNFSVLVSHVRVPPALEAILKADGPCIDGFLAAGHVCTIMGLKEYEPIAKNHGTPIVATGFEPVDILTGILMCIRQLERGDAHVENQYARAVDQSGNQTAQQIMQQVFEPADQTWRGIGALPDSGYRLRPAFNGFDASAKFELSATQNPPQTNDACISGAILRGAKKPIDCPAFGKSCSPEHPLGATMVSSEGACAAYYKYARRRRP